MAIEFGSRKETFENFKVYETTLAGRPFKVEMGKMCGLSNASALIRYGETCVLCNVVMSPKPREGVDFFPLNVEYEEKLYAAGRIPGSFMRREGRPGERAILTSRVVDRPMRPLFPKEMRNDVCITMTVMSLDPDCSPEIAGISEPDSRSRARFLSNASSGLSGTRKAETPASRQSAPAALSRCALRTSEHTPICAFSDCGFLARRPPHPKTSSPAIQRIRVFMVLKFSGSGAGRVAVISTRGS